MRRLALVSVIAALTGAAVLPASELAPTEFREVVSLATDIVRGRITDVRTYRAPDGGAATAATVAVDLVLKGQSGGFVSVHVPGGQIGRDKWIVVGAPALTAGRQAVFFLKRGSDNLLRPVGLSLGVYELYPDGKSGRAVVHPPLVRGTTASDGVVVRGDPRRRPMPVPEFESLVRFILVSQGAPGKGGVR